LGLVTNVIGYDSRYTFYAKEKDDETQYSYFGARYYDSDLSVWVVYHVALLERRVL
jgi:hypothetical protein